MLPSVVEPKDLDILNLAAHERPLSAPALACLKEVIQRELRRQIQLTLQRTAARPREGAIRLALIQLFGAQRSAAERRLFFLFAAPLMRDLLLQEVGASSHATFNGFDMLALDAALRRLDAFAPRQARMIDLHYFAGLGLRETADLLGLTERALGREIRFIKAWLASTRCSKVAGQR